MNQKEQFDEILNECLDGILKGQSVEECLLKYPQQAKELEPLLKTASAARAFSQIQPRVEFKARARYEFMSAVGEKTARASVKHGWFNWHWRSAWAMSLVSVIAVAVMGSGTVIAANHSMPDSVLYSVKIAAENAQLAITTSDVVKAELNAKYANRRVDEINYLAARGEANKIVAAVSNMNSNLQNMTNLTAFKTDVGESQPTMNDTAQFGALNSQSNTSAQPPAVAMGVSGGGTPAATTRAATSPTAVAAPVTGMVVPAPVVNVPPATVNVTVPNQAPALLAKSGASNESAAQYAVDNTSNTSKAVITQEKLRKIIDDNYLIRQSQLEKALENATPETRPAIRQAIADSEIEYAKAIYNLNVAATLNTLNSSNSTVPQTAPANTPEK
jgi:hypothetical protein